MNKILAWFITINFVNIAWIFFRAKEWDDAIKVLSGMFGFNEIIINRPFINVSMKDEIYAWIFVSFILVLFFKNSMEKRDSFKPNYKLAFLTVFCFIFAVLSLNKVSEFLYFNF